MDGFAPDGIAPNRIPLPPGQRILLTGSTGQVGTELLRSLAPLGEVVAPARESMDLTNAASIRESIRSLRPRWIVNPAAHTAVDKAESEPQLAYAINAEALQTIGEEARAIGAAVIHFSTDYVFDGTAASPYAETDATNPVSVYGASKLAGEKALAASGAPHMIFRTSWVYGPRGRNFLLTILKLARDRDVLRIVSDQHGAPTWTRDLAQMTAHVIARCEAAAQNQSQNQPQNRPLAEALAGASGIYHASGSGDSTWYEFAAEAVRLESEREPEVRFARIEAISTAEFPTAARRPANSRMNCNKLDTHFGWKMLDWHESLRRVLSELEAGVTGPR